MHLNRNSHPISPATHSVFPSIFRVITVNGLFIENNKLQEQVFNLKTCTFYWLLQSLIFFLIIFCVAKDNLPLKLSECFKNSLDECVAECVAKMILVFSSGGRRN